MIDKTPKEEVSNMVCRDAAITIQFNDTRDSVRNTINTLADLQMSGAIGSFFLCLTLKNK